MQLAHLINAVVKSLTETPRETCTWDISKGHLRLLESRLHDKVHRKRENGFLKFRSKSVTHILVFRQQIGEISLGLSLLIFLWTFWYQNHVKWVSDSPKSDEQRRRTMRSSKLQQLAAEKDGWWRESTLCRLLSPTVPVVRLTTSDRKKSGNSSSCYSGHLIRYCSGGNQMGKWAGFASSLLGLSDKITILSFPMSGITGTAWVQLGFPKSPALSASASTFAAIFWRTAVMIASNWT